MTKQIELRLPKISAEYLARLTSQQVDFITHPLNEPVFLVGCPGSGKTEVVGLKAAFDISGWTIPFAGIAVLTFTKNAALEIQKRVTSFLGDSGAKHPHFIGTIDSFLHAYILHSRGHSVVSYSGKAGDMSLNIVDSNPHAEYLRKYQTALKNDKPVSVADYYFNYKGECEDTYDRIRHLNTNIQKTLRLNKERFLKDGLTTYQDAEFVCRQALLDSKYAGTVAQRFPVIIVDECQDLSLAQLAILDCLVNAGTHLHLVGDLNQSIYEFKKVDPGRLTKFVQVHKLETKPLSENFRSSQPIVDLCHNLALNSSFVTAKPTSRIPSKLIGDSCIVIGVKSEELPSLISRFVSLVESEPEVVLANSAILVKNRSLLNKIQPATDGNANGAELIATALAIWNREPRDAKDLTYSLTCLGQGLSSIAWKGQGQKRMFSSPPNISGVQWRLFLRKFSEDASQELWPPHSATWTTWAKRLKQFLSNHWTQLPGTPSPFDECKNRLRSPSGKADDNVSASVPSVLPTKTKNVRLATIHEVKGESLDAIMLVSASSKSGKPSGTYFTDWLGDASNQEFIRLGYVASSRPRKLVVWAIPQSKLDSEEARLRSLGFSVRR